MMRRSARGRNLPAQFLLGMMLFESYTTRSKSLRILKNVYYTIGWDHENLQKLTNDIHSTFQGIWIFHRLKDHCDSVGCLSR